MELNKLLPESLLEVLNDFNQRSIQLKQDIELTSSERAASISNHKRKQILVHYNVKNSNFYFSVVYTLGLELIEWGFFPGSKDSTKKKTVPRKAVENQTYESLRDEMHTWFLLVLGKIRAKNPLDFYSEDTIVEFYANELKSYFISDELENIAPIPSDKQHLALEMLDKQSSFVLDHLSQIEDIESE